MGPIYHSCVWVNLNNVTLDNWIRDSSDSSDSSHRYSAIAVQLQKQTLNIREGEREREYIQEGLEDGSHEHAMRRGAAYSRDGKEKEKVIERHRYFM